MNESMRHEIITVFARMENNKFASIIKPKISRNLHILVLSTKNKNDAINDAKRMAEALEIDYLGEWENRKIHGGSVCTDDPKYGNEIARRIKEAENKLESGTITQKEYWKIIADIEEPNCKYFHDFSGDGFINVCLGNEPYSCKRAKSEGLCHKENDGKNVKEKEVNNMGKKVLAKKFLEVVQRVIDGKREMPTWDEFFDENNIGKGLRINFGVAAIYKQAAEIDKEFKLFLVGKSSKYDRLRECL